MFVFTFCLDILCYTMFSYFIWFFTSNTKLLTSATKKSTHVIRECFFRSTILFMKKTYSLYFSPGSELSLLILWQFRNALLLFPLRITKMSGVLYRLWL